MSSQPFSPQKEPSVPWWVWDMGLSPHMDTSVRTRRASQELQGTTNPGNTKSRAPQTDPAGITAAPIPQRLFSIPFSPSQGFPGHCRNLQHEPGCCWCNAFTHFHTFMLRLNMSLHIFLPSPAISSGNNLLLSALMLPSLAHIQVTKTSGPQSPIEE